MSLPSHTVSQLVPNAGNGLFTTATVGQGEEIFHVDRPLGYVLDSPNLQNTCANCLRKASTYDEAGTEDVTLKRCIGCKMVKYCGNDCHRESYKLGHRYECKIFSALYPDILPNTVRLVLHLLLRRQNRSLGDRDWSTFLSLQSHIPDFQVQQTKNGEGLTVWQTIELMGQATAKFSGSKEPVNNIQGMIARVLVNTHTLTTPTLDPLGLCLSPQSALLNHSCTPNAHIVFSDQKLVLRSLAPIEANVELTISYIDTSQPTLIRQAELRSRYFFTCTCSSCCAGTTNCIPDPVIDPAFQQIECRALDLQAEAVKLSPSEAATKLNSALELFKNYPPYRQPSASIQHNAFLNALARQDWPLALQYALKAYFHINPVHYPLSWHPVQVVTKWVLLRLVVQIAALAQEGDESVKRLARFEINWRIVIEGLWKEVSDGVILSHGEDNAFAVEVKAMGKGMGIDRGEVGKKDLEKESMKLRRVADEHGNQRRIIG